MPASSCWNSRRYPRAPKTASRFRACWCSRGDDKQPAGRYLSPVLTLEKPQAAELPDVFTRWFSARGWVARAHQLELLAKARSGRSALLIAPTGAGKTLAGFLPTLVELSTNAPRARSAPSPLGEGWGGGSKFSGAKGAPPPPPPPPHE